MNSNNIIPILKEIAKNPMAYVLFVVCGLMLGFVNWAINSNDLIRQEQQKQLEACIENSNKKDSIIKQIFEDRISDYIKRDSSTRERLLKRVEQ